MKNFILNLVLTTIVSTVSYNSASAAVACTGKINQILTYANGNVIVHSSWRNDFNVICNSKNEWNGITTSQCALWLSQALVAYKAKTNSTVYYENESNCAQIPTYGNSPPPVYFMNAALP